MSPLDASHYKRPCASPVPMVQSCVPCVRVAYESHLCLQTASSLPRRAEDRAPQAADPTLTRRLRELYASAPAPDAKQAGGGSPAIRQLLEVRTALRARYRTVDASACIRSQCSASTPCVVSTSFRLTALMRPAGDGNT